MIGASATGVVAAPSFLTTAKNNIETVASDAWTVTSWPETDLAADLGWSAGWLIMILGMAKVVSVGLHAEHKARGSFFRSR